MKGKVTPEELKALTAKRMAAALAHHSDVEVRRWRYRELTRAVAERSGVELSPDSGRTWLAGTQPRDPRVAAALAAVLDVPAGWLYFGEGEAEAQQEARGSRPATSDMLGQSTSKTSAKSARKTGKGSAA